MLFKKLKARILWAEREIASIKKELASLSSRGAAASESTPADCASLLDEWMNGGNEK